MATDFPNVAGAGNYASIGLTQFDPSIGTLTGVSLYFQGAIDSVYSVTSQSGSTVTINQYDASISMKLLKPADSIPASNSSAAYLTIAPAIVSLTAGSTVPPNINGTADSYDSATTAVSSADFSLFTGTGSVIFPIFTKTRTVTDLTGGNLNLSQTTQGVAEATVTYTYSVATTTVPSTPEPATFALFGGALLGLGLLRKRNVR